MNLVNNPELTRRLAARSQLIGRCHVAKRPVERDSVVTARNSLRFAERVSGRRRLPPSVSDWALQLTDTASRPLICTPARERDRPMAAFDFVSNWVKWIPVRPTYRGGQASMRPRHLVQGKCQLRPGQSQAVDSALPSDPRLKDARGR